tara:strand:+ start:61 stop:342 length:282 start_codon:yes stop_codon:yes gene_type:complete
VRVEESRLPPPRHDRRAQLSASAVFPQQGKSTLSQRETGGIINPPNFPLPRAAGEGGGEKNSPRPSQREGAGKEGDEPLPSLLRDCCYGLVRS